MLSRVSPTNEQFTQLQKENRRFREELDILKRAAVLLAKRWRWFSDQSLRHHPRWRQSREIRLRAFFASIYTRSLVIQGLSANSEVFCNLLRRFLSLVECLYCLDLHVLECWLLGGQSAVS